MLLAIIGVVLTLFTGDTKVFSGGKWEIPVLGMELKKGDSILVNYGKAEIKFDDSSTVMINKNTKIGIAAPAGKIRKLFLKVGSIWAKVRKLFGGEEFEIETPIVVAGVRGTEFLVSFNGSEAQTDVINGEVSVDQKETGKKFVIKPLQRILLRRKVIRRIERFDPSKLKRWYIWSKVYADRVIDRINKNQGNVDLLLDQADCLQKRLKIKELKMRIEKLRKEKGTLNENINRGLIDRLRYRLRRNTIGIKTVDSDLSKVNGILNRMRLQLNKAKELLNGKKYIDAKRVINSVENEMVGISILIPRLSRIIDITNRIKQDQLFIRRVIRKTPANSQIHQNASELLGEFITAVRISENATRKYKKIRTEFRLIKVRLLSLRSLLKEK